MTDPFASLRPCTYGCILADPPWSFTTWSKKRTTPHRGAKDHYDVMSLQDLMALPVGELARPDCALFMWAVGSHFDVAIELGKQWGFTFKTGDVLVWDKGRMGMGYWSRKQTETCMLFTRGKPRRQSKSVRQKITAPRREHSRKPDDQYGRIEALVAGPRLELFARTQRDGWTAWGDEVGRF